MPATTLSGDNLRALSPLVLDALGSREFRGVLADLIEGADSDLAGRLRLLKTYELTLKALDCGRYYERATASTCRGLILRYEAPIRRHRLWVGMYPPLIADDYGLFRLPENECCSLPTCPCRSPRSADYNTVSNWCVRRDHLLALVWRGLDGQAVPSDVESGLAALRESIRSTVAQSRR